MTSKREPADDALYHGDIHRLLDITAEKQGKEFRRGEQNVTEENIHKRLAGRALISLVHEMEGWVVSLSRWILQAASSFGGAKPAPVGGGPIGSTMIGPSSNIFANCSEALHPTAYELIERSHVTGVVTRVAVRTALVQCMAHQGVIETLVERGASVNQQTKVVHRASIQPRTDSPCCLIHDVPYPCHRVTCHCRCPIIDE